MKTADIFAGCGLASVGLKAASVGLKAAGCDVQLACEWDDWAGLSYHVNHLHTGFFNGNLFLCKPSDVLSEYLFKPECRNLLWASPPCPSFSRSGSRRADADVRSKLLFWPLAAAEYLPNSWIVIENVPGLLEANNEALYHRLLDGFYWAGRNITLFELDAKDFGLAASRKRIFLVIPPLGMGIPQCPKPSPSAKCITLRDAIHPECGFVDPDPEFIPLTDTERAVYEGIGPGQDWSATERGREYAKRKFGPQVQPGDHKDFLSRPGWDAPAPCITASAPNVIGARYTMIHPEEARSYTVGELKALAGAPPGYFLAGPVQERLRQVGNCCPPVLAEVVARAILEHEEKVRQDSIAA